MNGPRTIGGQRRAILLAAVALLAALAATTLGFAIASNVADDTSRPGVTVQTRDVCVIFPNQLTGFPDVAEVRSPQIVRYRVVDDGTPPSSWLLWLPGRPVMLVDRLIVALAPPLPDGCAVLGNWPEPT